jgi:hypothetical protein
LTVSRLQKQSSYANQLIRGACHTPDYWNVFQILLQATVEILRLSSFSQATANFKEHIARYDSVGAGNCQLVQSDYPQQRPNYSTGMVEAAEKNREAEASRLTARSKERRLAAGLTSVRHAYEA